VKYISPDEALAIFKNDIRMTSDIAQSLRDRRKSAWRRVKY